jgi:class 3 adenylate cyclase/YHS domain-containing protein
MDRSREIDLVLVIADLSGYTALTEAHGSGHAAKAVARYVEIAEVVVQPGARLVERVGDELLIVTTDAVAAVRTTIALRDAVEREPLFPTVRAGIHAGHVLEENGHYFGTALNLASRVATYARAGQILCTARVVALSGELDTVEYRTLGDVRFKNLVDPVPIFEVLAGPRTGEAGFNSIDPVCRMQVRPDTAPARLPFGGETYYFCSFDCARAFAGRPEVYASSGTHP